MASRTPKTDPIVNQARVRDQTIARSERAEDEPVMLVCSTPESRTRRITRREEQGARSAQAVGRRG